MVKHFYSYNMGTPLDEDFNLHSYVVVGGERATGI